ncbi:MAG: hypothetical protein JST39_25215 [Bacteroidetes bacterium]|nr:hypothetical protein [Bacteroidota bacterium]
MDTIKLNTDTYSECPLLNFVLSNTAVKMSKTIFITGASFGLGKAQSFNKLFKNKTALTPVAFKEQFLND